MSKLRPVKVIDLRDGEARLVFEMGRVSIAA